MISRAEPRPRRAVDGEGPAPVSVSIIICTRDRRRDLARALASLGPSLVDAAGVEVVVVEETNTPAPITGVTYVAIPPGDQGFGSTRNRALEIARGEILVFFDDDCEAAPGWLNALLAPLRNDPALGGAAGSVLVHETNLIGHAENVLGFPGGGLRSLAESRGQIHETRHLSTCNCAYRRWAIEEAGGFPTAARFGAEDTVLAERITARRRCVYVPEARVFHRARGSVAGVFRWFVRRGRSEVHVLPLRRRPRESVAYIVRTSILLRAGLLAAMVLLLPCPAILSTVVLAAAYYCVMLWRYRFALRYADARRAWPLVPLVKAVMDVGFEVGKIRALASRGRR